MEFIEVMKQLQNQLLDQFEKFSTKMETLIEQKFQQFHQKFENAQFKQKAQVEQSQSEQNNQEEQEEQEEHGDKNKQSLLDEINRRFDDFQGQALQNQMENQKFFAQKIESQLDQLLRLINQKYIDEKYVHQLPDIENHQLRNNIDKIMLSSPQSTIKSDQGNPFKTKCTKPLNFCAFLQQQPLDNKPQICINESQNISKSMVSHNDSEQLNIFKDIHKQDESETQNLWLPQEEKSFLFNSQNLNSQTQSVHQDPNSTQIYTHSDRRHLFDSQYSFLSEIQEQSQQQFYVTRTGHKYHREWCQYLSWSKIPIGKNEIIRQGYGACSKCI